MNNESVVLMVFFGTIGVCFIAFLIFLGYIEKLDRKYPKPKRVNHGLHSPYNDTYNKDPMWKYKSKPTKRGKQ